MSPKTRALDAKDFAFIKHTVELRSESRHELEADDGFATPLPREVDLQLTYRCNLRCSHCYQWAEQGFFRDFSLQKQRAELDIGVVRDVLETTEDLRSRLYIWGGEPLMHTKFAEVAELLRQYPRDTTMCTNGLLLKRNLRHLLGIEGLRIVVSLDGLDEDHDVLRGSGAFERTVRNIRTMLDLKKSGEYLGSVSLNCMISHATVPRIYEFMEWAEGLGLHQVNFQFPWYISPEVANAMDALYDRDFSWLHADTGTKQRTWHSYSYRLPPELIPELRDSMSRISSRKWNTLVRYQPQVEDEEVSGFILGDPAPVQNKSRCLAVTNRLEVHADGNVSSCKFFPEFVVGNLYDTPVAELWQSPKFRKVRLILAQNGMMPVCSRCTLLYNCGV